MAHGASGAIPVTAEHGEHEHPQENVYIRVAGFLAIVTIIEVAIYYFDIPHSILVTALLVLSAVKFTAVVGFFMHLKFDDRRLLYIFAGGLIVGGAILIALDVLHDVHPIDYGHDMLTTQSAAAEPAQ